MCLAFPHRTKGFLGTFHRQNDADFWLDPGQDDYIDLPLAELEYEVFGLRPPDLVRAGR